MILPSFYSTGMDSLSSGDTVTLQIQNLAGSVISVGEVRNHSNQ